MSDFWNGRRVFVTGAEGFIGSHLVEALSREGANVRAFVHYNPFGRRGWLERHAEDIEIIPGDIRDSQRLLDGIKGCDVVFHLASLIGIPYSYDAPDSYVETNVVGTMNVLNACRRLGVARLVHTSTSEVYGSALRVPIDESHPLQPQSPYSATKMAADMLAISYHRSFELPVAIVRPFNTYGPRQSSRAIIPTILGQLSDGTRELRIGSLVPRRDFNFVEDTVRGFLAVAVCEKATGEVVNVGSGLDVSMGELVELLFEITGERAEVVTDPMRLRPAGSEVDRLLCDNTRAKEWAHWAPQVSLQEGLTITAAWVRENPPILKAKSYQV